MPFGPANESAVTAAGTDDRGRAVRFRRLMHGNPCVLRLRLAVADRRIAVPKREPFRLARLDRREVVGGEVRRGENEREDSESLHGSSCGFGTAAVVERRAHRSTQEKAIAILAQSYRGGSAFVELAPRAPAPWESASRAIVAARRPSCAESSSALGLVSFVRFPWTRSSINGVSKETVGLPTMNSAEPHGRLSPHRSATAGGFAEHAILPRSPCHSTGSQRESGRCSSPTRRSHDRASHQ